MAQLTKNKFLLANVLIHLFALAHALVVVLFKFWSVPDEIPLTILTVLLIIIVARLNKFPYDLSAVLALMFCFAGFFIGTKGGELITKYCTGFMHDNANVIMTILVTELVGWTTYLVATKIQPREYPDNQR